tara:strand:+ start:314 stop:520 length:207 start_codon:yes stop_codon:yes gene_type:complete
MLGRVANLQRALLSLLQSSRDDTSLDAIESLADGPGEVSIIQALMAGLLNSGTVFQVKPGRFKWNGGD